MLIGAEGTKTPAGGRGRGDPAGALATRRLPEPPAESEVPGAEITATKRLGGNDNGTAN
jgi:hypothetical protein